MHHSGHKLVDQPVDGDRTATVLLAAYRISVGSSRDPATANRPLTPAPPARVAAPGAACCVAWGTSDGSRGVRPPPVLRRRRIGVRQPNRNPGFEPVRDFRRDDLTARRPRARQPIRALHDRRQSPLREAENVKALAVAIGAHGEAVHVAGKPCADRTRSRASRAALLRSACCFTVGHLNTMHRPTTPIRWARSCQPD
jgi:hypothetical protein